MALRIADSFTVPTSRQRSAVLKGIGGKEIELRPKGVQGAFGLLTRCNLSNGEPIQAINTLIQVQLWGQPGDNFLKQKQNYNSLIVKGFRSIAPIE